jgi:hypothetical protein
VGGEQWVNDRSNLAGVRAETDLSLSHLLEILVTMLLGADTLSRVSG